MCNCENDHPGFRCSGFECNKWYGCHNKKEEQSSPGATTVTEKEQLFVLTMAFDQLTFEQANLVQNAVFSNEDVMSTRPNFEVQLRKEES